MGGGRVKNGKRCLEAAALTAAFWGLAAWALVRTGPHHAWSGINLTSAALLVLFGRLFGQIPLSVPACLLLFPVLALETLLFYGPLAHAPFLVIFFLTDCTLLLYWKEKSLNAHFAGLSATAFASVLLLLGYEVLAEKLLPCYYAFTRSMGFTTLSRILLILGFGIFYMLSVLLALKLLGLLLRKWKVSLRGFWERFSGLEQYVFFLVVFTIFLMLLVESGYVLNGTYSYMSRRMLWFQVFFLFMDMVYLGLLAKAVSIKEKAVAAQKDKEVALAYSAVLERNMESLREVRHDTKNLFLAMGGFVERSQDGQMKAFYREHIVPFMEDALVKSGIQEKLAFITDFPLKAFLYQKIAEELEAGISVRLELSGPVSAAGSTGELVRLLGILLDNAAEEVLFAGGEVHIIVKEDVSCVRFRIGNAVRPKVRERGVAAGRSEKGEGRGNGLRIAERILSENKGLVLNSYFTEQEFVQSLTVLKRG